jgi:AcrR family transcriptional regulator
MARPRSFSSERVVEAAKGVFWEKGYQHTAVEDLEQATGLNRSSLYGAFGTKAAIFDQALGLYLRGFIGPRLPPMESPGAGVGDIEGFFADLATFFRTDERGRQGCLMINTIAESEREGDHLGGRAHAFADRLHGAFANALTGLGKPSLAQQRARLLTAAAFGIWLMARIDPEAAAGACDAAIASLPVRT